MIKMGPLEQVVVCSRPLGTHLLEIHLSALVSFSSKCMNLIKLLNLSRDIVALKKGWESDFHRLLRGPLGTYEHLRVSWHGSHSRFHFFSFSLYSIIQKCLSICKHFM